MYAIPPTFIVRGTVALTVVILVDVALATTAILTLAVSFLPVAPGAMDVTVIVTLPAFLPVTRPSEETVAILVFEDFQVTFGVDTNAALDGEIDFIDPDGDGDPYLTAAQVNALAGTPADKWARVVSVRISLLMRTVEDNVLPESQTYTYNGTTTTPTDRRLRKVFTHVVAMRNR